MKEISRAITEEQIQNRKNEIINSCYEVYLEKGFIETSIKDISQKLTFARSSIYNYYQTKEEIFLDLLRNEYRYLNNDLNEIYNFDSLTKEEFASFISKAVSKRIVLLQILSTSLNELEKHSRIEYLIDFKKSFGNTLNIIKDLLLKYITSNQEMIDTFIELFFPFLFGLCSFTIVSNKQLEAMEKAGIKWISRTTEELCYDFIINQIK